MATIDEAVDAMYIGQLARRRSWDEGLVIGYSISRNQFYHYRKGRPDITHFVSQADKLADDWETISPTDYLKTFA